jgi:hypothetical protein
VYDFFIPMWTSSVIWRYEHVYFWSFIGMFLYYDEDGSPPTNVQKSSDSSIYLKSLQQSSGMWRYVVWQKCTDVSEEVDASIHEVDVWSSTLTTDASDSSEMFVHFYHTIQHHSPDHSNLYRHQHKILTPLMISLILITRRAMYV